MPARSHFLKTPEPLKLYHKLGSKDLKHEAIGSISDANNDIRSIKKEKLRGEGSLGDGDITDMSLTVQARRITCTVAE